MKRVTVYSLAAIYTTEDALRANPPAARDEALAKGVEAGRVALAELDADPS